jgi:hypothetical protein
VAPISIVRCVPKTNGSLPSLPGFSIESPNCSDSEIISPEYVIVKKPMAANYPSFSTQYRRLKEKYSSHNLNETRASNTLTASLCNSKNYYDNLPNYHTPDTQIAEQSIINQTDPSIGIHYTDYQLKRKLIKMGPKQQKGKHGKKPKQVQNQKLLSFPDKIASTSISTELKVVPLAPNMGNPACPSGNIDPEAARYLPDESDDDLIDPADTVAAVFSTEELLSQTDTALLVLSKADLSKIKIEKMDGASSRDSSSEAVTETPQALSTQETVETFVAFTKRLIE